MSTPGGPPPQDPPSWPGRPAEEPDAPSGPVVPQGPPPLSEPYKPESWYPTPPPSAPPPHVPSSWGAPPPHPAPTGQYPITPGYGSPPYPPPPSAPPGASWGYQGAGVFGYVGPGGAVGPPAYLGGSGPGFPAGGWRPAPPPPNKSQRTALIVGLVVLLVAALGVAGFVLLNGNSKPEFTFNGKSISNADAVLQEGEKQVSDQVSTRHGAKGDDTRCYFAVPKEPASGARKTDISPQLLCGPVLFVDGDAKQAYLTYNVNQTSSENGKVVLAVSDVPQSPNPTSLPQSLNLQRPDGETPPSGSGGLKPPTPPAAAQDALVAADVDQSKLVKAPTTAVMVGDTYGVRLTAAGDVDRYGSGDSARVAPSGTQLLAFTYVSVAGATSEPVQSRQLTIQVGSSPARPVPGRTPAVVVATQSGQPVKLIMVDKGIRQELSLPAGKPGPENIVINVRQHRSASVSKSGGFKMNLRDGSATGSFRGRYLVSGAGLYGTVDGHRPSSPRDCFFAMKQLTYKRIGKISGAFTSTGSGPFSFRGPLLHVIVNGKRHPAIQTGGYTYFQIPATATSVTVTVSGKVRVGNGITESLATPVTFRITFRPG